MGSAHPLVMTDLLCRVPGISGRMVSETYQVMQSSWVSALFKAPLSGVPYKIFAVHAGTMQVGLAMFLLMTIPSRLIRVFLVAGVASAIGKVLQKNIREHCLRWMSYYAIIWMAFYFAYALIIRIVY
jgi:hypothetical protein